MFEICLNVTFFSYRQAAPAKADASHGILRSIIQTKPARPAGDGIMKILIAGHGAKEHALAMAMDRHGDCELMVIPGNPGTVEIEHDQESSAADIDHTLSLEDAAKAFGPDLILSIDEKVCKSDKLDNLRAKGYRVLAPSQKAARALINTPEWMQNLRERNIRTADFEIVNTYSDAYNILQTTDAPWIIRSYGEKSLFGIVYSLDEGMDLLDAIFMTRVDKILITEFLEGPRFNLSVLIYNNQIVTMDPVRIVRGMYEQEDDPQRKGMGAWSPVEGIDENVVKECVEGFLIPVLEDLRDKDHEFNGFINAEFILEEDGPTLVNLKPGLPEIGSCVLFPRLDCEMEETIERLMSGKKIRIPFKPTSCTALSMAAEDFPERKSFGAPINFDEDMEGTVYHHHTRVEDGQLETNGGRILVVCATGQNFKQSAKNAVDACTHVKCDDLFYRTDINPDMQN